MVGRYLYLNLKIIKMMKKLFKLAVLITSTSLSAQEGPEPACSIVCLDDITVTADQGADSAVVTYDPIMYTCSGTIPECFIKYEIDALDSDSQNNGNHGVNTNYAGNAWIIANDFDVPEDTTYQLKSFHPVLVNYATAADIYIYANNNGQPGTLLHTFEDIAMNNMVPLGNNPYGNPIYEAEYILPNTVEMTTGKYWIGFHTEYLNPPNAYVTVYWATAGDDNIPANGYRAFRSSNGTSWNTSGGLRNADGAFTLKYECEQPQLNRTQGMESGDSFPVGTTQVVYELESGGEILDTCTFSVTVLPHSLDVTKFENERTKLYPNPVSNILSIESQDSIEHISIYDGAGRLVFNKKSKLQTLQIDLSNFGSGIYEAVVKTAKGTKSYKVIKK